MPKQLPGVSTSNTGDNKPCHLTLSKEVSKHISPLAFKAIILKWQHFICEVNAVVFTKYNPVMISKL